MITGIIIARDEEKIIIRALQSLKFCTEMIVVDNNSSDNTAKVAEKAGAQVFDNKVHNNFARLRNDAMKHASHEWILFLDADEIISDDLRIHIKHELQNPQFSSYYLRRRDHFWGRILEHGEVATVYERGIIRLMKKGSGAWEGQIHEEWNSKDEIGEIDGFIEHVPHPDITSFLDSVNHYSSIRAHELMKSHVRVRPFQLVVYPVGKFFYTYIIKGGWRDGAHGFVYSLMMSFHSFLVRAKVLTHST